MKWATSFQGEAVLQADPVYVSSSANGADGLPGATGPAGPQGIQGVKGDKGDPGSGGSGAVSSVNGQTGAVVLAAPDVGADVSGAAATAQAAAIAASQPLDSDLTAIALLATTTYGRSLLTQADAAALRATAGLGTAATQASSAFDTAGAAAAAQAASQPLDSDLTAIALLATTSFGRSFLTLADAAAGRTLLGLGTAATSAATAFDASGLAAAAQAASQPLDADLTTIAGLTATTDSIIQSKASAWSVRTPAQFKTDLALVKGDVGLGNVDNTSDASKNSAAVTLTNKTLTSPAINTPTGIVKGDVGLGNVDNTSDASKNSATATLTNKRVTRRVTALSNPGATPTINTDNCDVVNITGQTADITSMTTNLTGTPVDGDLLRFSITGTAARAITWGASFEASTTALPTTTVTTSRLDAGFFWNSATSKWRCVAVA